MEIPVLDLGEGSILVNNIVIQEDDFRDIVALVHQGIEIDANHYTDEAYYSVLSLLYAAGGTPDYIITDNPRPLDADSLAARFRERPAKVTFGPLKFYVVG